MNKIKIPFYARAKPGFVLAIITLLIAVLLSHYSVTRLIRSSRLVDHTHLVIIKLESILSGLKDAETGLQGYLLTGEEHFLEPYSDSYRRVTLTAKDLDSLTKDNPAQQQRLDTLADLIEKRFDLIRRAITSYQNQNSHDTTLVRQGKTVMDQCRILVSRMERAEHRLLAGHVTLADQYKAYTPILLSLLSLAALLAVIINYTRLQRTVQRLQAAQGEIKAKNRLIEGIVQHFPITLSKVDQQGYFQLVDGSATNQFNLPAEALTGKNIFDVFPQVTEPVKRALSGESVSFEGCAPANGEIAYFQNYYYYDPASNCAIGVSINITEQRLARQALQEKNEQLSVAIEELKSTEEQLTEMNSALEQKVEERTARLAAQQAVLHNLFMQAPAVIGILHGPDHVYELANHACEQLFGFRGLQGKKIREVIPEIEGQAVIDLLDHVYQTGETFIANEIPLMIADNQDSPPEPAYFNTMYKALYSCEGAIEGIFSFGYEVTEQVLARKKVEESEARFRQLIESNIIGVLYWDLDGGIMDANDAFLHRLGYTREDLEAGLDWRQMTPPQWIEKDQEGLRQLIATERHLPFEKQYLHKDGTPVDVIIGSSAFAGTHNRQGVTFVLDITERKRVEQALKESEERFRAMADNIPNLAWMANADGWIFWYNNRWYEYTGTTPAHMEGWGWQSVHDPAVLPEVMEQWSSSIATGKPFEMVFPLKGVDGVFRPFLTRVIPVSNSIGQIEKWFGTNTDITGQQLAQQQLQALNEELATTNEELAAITEELAAANEELRSANEEIQASNEELGAANQQLIRINRDLDNFVYTASHDLKAPITNIEGLMRALERNLSPESLQKETTQKVIRLIYDSVHRFKGTIADLAEVVKVQKGEQEAVAEVNLWQVVEEVKLDLDGQITETDARIESNINQEQLIRFSRKNLKSIIYNLLSNALKYRSPDRRPLIRITLEQLPGYVLFTIEDNGLGMNLKTGNQIFQMFKRLHNHVEGSGIGLYIVKKIVDDADGHIEAESEVGQGSVFKVYFKA